jgi:hypothetical protein
MSDTVPVIIYLNEAVYDQVDSICKTVGTDLRDLIEKKTNADLLHLHKNLSRGGHHVTRPKNR